MYNVPYYNCAYSHLPEDEPLGSQHLEDIKFKNQNINSENVNFVGLYYIIIWQYTVQKAQNTVTS
jgi:hypothetical protein